MITYVSSVIGARLQAVVNAVDSATTPGQLVVFDASNNPLVTFSLGKPSGVVKGTTIVWNNVVAKASLGGTPISAQMQNGSGSYVATVGIPSDLIVNPVPIVAGQLAAVVGTFFGN